MDKETLASFFDDDGRLVNEHEFRKTIFQAGVHEEIRSETWKFLFQYYKYNSTPRERIIKDTELQVEYEIMKLRWQQLFDFCQNINEDQINDSIILPSLPFNIDLSHLRSENSSLVNIDYIKIQAILKISRVKLNLKKLMADMKQVEKDVPRTGFLIEVDENANKRQDLDKLSASLRNILVTFSAFHQITDDDAAAADKNSCKSDLGYTQGMNELASIFLCVFEHDESTAYWCYSNYMLLDQHEASAITLNTVEIDKTHALKLNIAYYFSQVGISLKLKQLKALLASIDPELYNRLAEFNLENVYFCHEWLLLCFKRLFKCTDGAYLNFFERIASHFIELNTASMAGEFKEKQIDINNIFTFDLFICLALINEMRPTILDRTCCEHDTDVYNLVRSSYKDISQETFNQIFQRAETIFNRYSCKKEETQKVVKKPLTSRFYL